MHKSTKSRLRGFLNLLLVLTASFLFFFLGFKTKDSGYYDEVIRPKLKNAFIPVLNVFRSRSDDMLEIRIDIEAQYIDSLENIRAQAMEDGVFLRGKDRWFPARLSFEDTTHEVRLRLKGGLLDHLISDRWSFRIRTDSNAVLGMSRFSIQHPNTRNFVYEWVLHQVAAQEGLIALQYHFADVRINEKMGGIYAIEEHFDEALLLRNGRAPGPILKFDDEARIAWLALEKSMKVDSVLDIPNFYLDAAIEIYKSEAWQTNDTTRAQLQRAMELLSGFRDGRSTTSQSFDVDRMARLFALADLLGAQHCTDWRNLRFYYNADQEKLEPIVYDGNAGERIPAIIALRKHAGQLHFDGAVVHNFYERLFSDKAFYNAYLRELQHYSESGVLEGILTPLEEGIKDQVSIINSEFPNFHYDPQIFYDCRELVRYSIDPPVALHAYIDTLMDGELLLSLSNTQGLPIEVLKVKGPEGEWIPPHSYLLLSGSSEQPPVFSSYRFFALGHRGKSLKDHEVFYRILGTDKVRVQALRSYTSGVKKKLNAPARHSYSGGDTEDRYDKR